MTEIEKFLRDFPDRALTVDFDPQGFTWMHNDKNCFRLLIHPPEGHLCGTQGPTIDEAVQGLRNLIAEYRESAART